MEYANRLAELRGDMSQDEFARLIGLKQQNYWKYENGKQGMRSDLIKKICKMFSCSAEWLLCMDAIPTKAMGEATVPLLGHIAAGDPIPMDAVDDSREVPARYKVDDPECFLLRVDGDSVNTLIKLVTLCHSMSQ